MRLLTGLAAWSVLVVASAASLASQERAEERVVRVIPGPLPAKPWPRCGSFADERIKRNVAYTRSARPVQTGNGPLIKLQWVQ
jgi:hypothetical protein